MNLSTLYYVRYKTMQSHEVISYGPFASKADAEAYVTSERAKEPEHVGDWQICPLNAVVPDEADPVVPEEAGPGEWKAAQPGEVPPDAVRVHLSSPRAVMRPRGPMAKNSLGAAILEKMEAAREHWADPKYGDNPSPERMEQLILRATLEETLIAMEAFTQRRLEADPSA